MSQARRLPGRTSRSGQGSPDFPITTNNENHLCTYWGQGVQAPGPTQLGRVSPRTHLSRGPCGATGSQLSDNTGPESLGALWAVRRVRALLMAWILEASLLTGSPASCSPLPPQRLPIGELPPQCPPPPRAQQPPSLTHLGLRPYTLPVPARWEVGLRRVVPLPLPPRNPPLKLRPRRNLPDTPKVSVLSFRSSAHVVRLELKHRQVRETKCSSASSRLRARARPPSPGGREGRQVVSAAGASRAGDPVGTRQPQNRHCGSSQIPHRPGESVTGLGC